MVSIVANDINNLVANGAHLVRIGLKKTPARRWRWDPITGGEAVQWLDEGGTLGVMPSSLGMIVVDMDHALNRPGEEVMAEDVEPFRQASPPVLSLKTPRGLHFWYPHPSALKCYRYRQRHQKRDCQHRNRDGMEMHGMRYDIRGCNGYVVLHYDESIQMLNLHVPFKAGEGVQAPPIPDNRFRGDDGGGGEGNNIVYSEFYPPPSEIRGGRLRFRWCLEQLEGVDRGKRQTAVYKTAELAIFDRVDRLKDMSEERIASEIVAAVERRAVSLGLEFDSVEVEREVHAGITAGKKRWEAKRWNWGRRGKRTDPWKSKPAKTRTKSGGDETGQPAEGRWQGGRWQATESGESGTSY